MSCMCMRGVGFDVSMCGPFIGRLLLCMDMLSMLVSMCGSGSSTVYSSSTSRSNGCIDWERRGVLIGS